MVALLSIIWMSTPSWAEDSIAQELRIEIRQPDTPLFGYSVRLLDVEHRMELGNDYPDSTGVLTLRSMPYGDYRLQISNAAGVVVREEFVRVDRPNSFVQINLPVQSEVARPASDRISVTQLQHPPG